MKNSYKYIQSVFNGTLFLLLMLIPSVADARPLVHSVYTIPEGGIDVHASESVYRLKSDYRVDSFRFGLGIITDLSMFVTFNFLHDGIFTQGETEQGDTGLSFWCYLGDYLDDSLMLGFLVSFRLPTGIDAYSERKWRNLALGHNEITIGPCMQYKVNRYIAGTFNFLYTFREDRGENFYKGLYIDPTKSETYKKIFGFNPFYDDNFFSPEQLKNDYIQFIFSIQTDYLFPVLFYTEFYSSFRVYQDEIDTDDVPIEGAKYSSVIMSSVGLRYFFTRDFYFGLYVVVNLREQKDFIQKRIGLECSILF